MQIPTTLLDAMKAGLGAAGLAATLGTAAVALPASAEAGTPIPADEVESLNALNLAHDMGPIVPTSWESDPCPPCGRG